MFSANSDVSFSRAQHRRPRAVPYRERAPLRPNLVALAGFSTYYYSVDVVVPRICRSKKEYPAAQLDLVATVRIEGDIRKLVADLHLTGRQLPPA